jgi:phenylalanyl-tRNA synthetase beta chain
MKTSVQWLRSLLEPSDLSVAEAEAVLTDLGFPIDAHETVASWPSPPWAPKGFASAASDVRLEVEFTSNRGDALAHWPLAREIAARTGRTMHSAEAWLASLSQGTGQGNSGTAASAGPVTRLLTLTAEPSITQPPSDHGPWAPCPRFTARVIHGVGIGPSPAWLAGALEAVGQRSINNVVDVTNFINLFLGQPTHAFDLAKLAGGQLIVRWARAGESLRTLDGKSRTLAADELVVADANRAQSLAGVIGGGDSEVDASTRDIVLEVATWDPMLVRRAARRHQIRTEASHRFERRVHPATIDKPGLLAASLIAQLGGGVLDAIMLELGGPELDARGASARTIALRLTRIERVLGLALSSSEARGLLGRLGIQADESPSGILTCLVPPERTDLTHEIDLIEELARLHGYSKIPVHESLSVKAKSPQATERAASAIALTLTGLGFFETVTYSFTSSKRAAALLPAGHELVEVDDDRRAHEPTLRPSVLAGLLACRKANQDGQVEQPGGVRLFELASTFAQVRETSAGTPNPGSHTRSVESRTLALLMDVPGAIAWKPAALADVQQGVRLMRGAIESVVVVLGGAVDVECEPAPPISRAFSSDGHARLKVRGRSLGTIGVIEPQTLKLFGLEIPLIGAELELAGLIELFPPKANVSPLPAFPAVERDLSLIVPESLTWAELSRVIIAEPPNRMERLSMVGIYRGVQAGEGKKSVTVRLCFRDPARTLRREEVDPDLGVLVERLGKQIGASLRA